MEAKKHTANQEIDTSITEALEQEKNNEKARQQEDALQGLASSLCTEFRTFATQRNPIEQRWIQDMTQYHGRYYNEEELGFNEVSANAASTKKRSNLFVNVTRSKTDAAEARMADMLFPSDDKNWETRPTPNPEMAEALKNKTPVTVNGQQVINEDVSTAENQVPMTEGDLAKAELEDIKIRSDKMSVQIADQLIECNYASESRKSIRDTVLIGTGIIKGPMQVGKTRRVWVPKTEGDATVHVLEIEEVVRPYAYRVDPWNFYPDMTASCIEESEKTFEIQYKTKAQMKELLKTPGFIKSQVRKVLSKSPNETKESVVSDHIEQLRRLAGIDTAGFTDSRYKLIEYHGPIDTQTLVALGIDIDEDDPLDMREGFVWFVDDIAVKFALHHLDSEDKLYSVNNWEKDDASIFGYGVPYTMRSPQKVISAAWRMIMDNAGLSTGPQIVINRDMLEPQDSSWELTPRKIWYANDEDLDITKAFTTFNIESHQQELLQIFHEAKKLAEEETNLPMVSQGMQGTAGSTFSGMSMLMNASNITLRRAVKYYDDNMTVPTITRFYDWNMQFNPDNDIKGDFEVHARGTGALMVKELQSQGLMAMMNFASHPTFGPMLKSDDLLRMTAKSLHVDPKEVVKDSETIEKEAEDRAKLAAQQGDVVSADVQAKVEAQLIVAEMSKETNEDKMALQLHLSDRKTEELVATLAAEQGRSADEIAAQYDIESYKVSAEDRRFYDELAVKLKEGSGI